MRSSSSNSGKSSSSSRRRRRSKTMLSISSAGAIPSSSFSSPSSSSTGNSNNPHEGNSLSSSPSYTIQASATAAAVPGGGGGSIHMPRIRSSSSCSGQYQSGSLPSPSNPPSVLADCASMTPLQRQLVWGEEELRLRIREVEEDVDTLKATARALCLKGKWEEAEVVVKKLYLDRSVEEEEEGGLKRTWRRSMGTGQRMEYSERRRVAARKRKEMRRVERVGVPLSLAFLHVCRAEEAWPSALSFVDEVLLEKETEKGAGEEGKEEGLLMPSTILPLKKELAQEALHICVGAGDIRRALEITRRAEAGESALLLDLALQACAMHKKRPQSSPSSAPPSAPFSSSSFLQPPLPPPAATTEETTLGVTVLTLIREARCRTPRTPAAPAARAISPSQRGWEAASSALTAAGPLRLLLSEAKRVAAVAAAVGSSPSSSLPSSSSSPPMWLLYEKAIRASVDEGQEAEALLLYREGVRWATVEGEGGKERTVSSTTSPTTSSSSSSSYGAIPVAIHEAALEAYARRGLWRPALEVLDGLRKEEMDGRREGGPSVACFNAAIRACCVGNEWERGVGLLRRMEAAGQEADEETYGVILQAFARAGEWKGSLKLLEYIEKKTEGGREGGREGGVTPALARAAANICVRAQRYEEARALVASVLHRGKETSSSFTSSSSSSSSSSSPSSVALPAIQPAFLALGLWSLACATPSSWAGPSRQEEAFQLVTALMDSQTPIALETYEHACQALLSLGGGSSTSTSTSTSSQKYETALRDVYRHGVAAGVLPSSPPSLTSSSSSPPSVDLRGLRPTLAKVAMVSALESLLHLHPLQNKKEEGREERCVMTASSSSFSSSSSSSFSSSSSSSSSSFSSFFFPYSSSSSHAPSPLIIITGTGRVKGAVQRFLRTACFPPLLPQPVPYNAGRLLLPWSQIQCWKEGGGMVALSTSVGVEKGKVGGGNGKGGGDGGGEGGGGGGRGRRGGGG
ncbi:pentatricopeptide repeat containing protein [Nannochloropsis oceanica]